MRSLIAAVFVCVLMGSVAPAFAGDLVVTNIATKIVTRDSDGVIWFAIKCTVTNRGTWERPGVILQAVGFDGFEIKTVSLAGDLGPGQTKTLTTKDYMAEKDFKRIAKWQLER
jgi:hypothetical protein